jgi:hypothetical protein
MPPMGRAYWHDTAGTVRRATERTGHAPHLEPELRVGSPAVRLPDPALVLVQQRVCSPFTPTQSCSTLHREAKWESHRRAPGRNPEQFVPGPRHYGEQA